jgi:hypothetical protein
MVLTTTERVRWWRTTLGRAVAAGVHQHCRVFVLDRDEDLILGAGGEQVVKGSHALWSRVDAHHFFHVRGLRPDGAGEVEIALAD